MNDIRNYVDVGAFRSILQVALLLLASSLLLAQAPTSSISNLAYEELTSRVTQNVTNFYVYQDQDSGFNHGFPSGFFWYDSAPVTIDAGCLDDPADMVTGCYPSNDMTHLDRVHGTVLRISFPSESGDGYTGLNTEEPEDWGVYQDGVGYDLRPATQLVLDVRSPTGIKLQFGVGGCQSNFLSVPKSATYTTMTITISSLVNGANCPPNLSNVHVLLTVVTNAANAPNGGTILLDNAHFTPVPTRQATDPKALSLPLSTQTFGVVPQQDLNYVPPDQVNRNAATIYEASVTLLALLQRGQTSDLANAREIANALDYALHHDNHGDPLPLAPDGSVGLHNAYESGDIALQNDQRFGGGKAGDVRLAGFTATGCTPTSFCLVLDGATGGNNAFAILALAAAYEQFGNITYLNDALDIGDWIYGNLLDNTNTGFGGYYLGYPDMGQQKNLIVGKSVENNADIFAAFTQLSGIEQQLGNSGAAALWTMRANIAGDFVASIYDSANGRFNAGTVPVGTPPSYGVCPYGPQKGNDVINICDFVDSNTFTTLALSATQRYSNQINWQLPINYVWSVFPQSVMADGLTFQGLDIVPPPPVGPAGIAWEFTGQPVETCFYVDSFFGSSTCGSLGQLYLGQIRLAQTSAPFADGLGLVASTLPNGDQLPPLDQCLNTPFQCIPERVGIAATAWAIYADMKVNPLATPIVALSPSSLNFGYQGLHNLVVPLTSVLTNTGNGPLTVTNISITGADGVDFSQGNTCPMNPNTLAPGNSCKITVVFAPTQTGQRTAAVTIMDNSTGSPQTIFLTGVGVGGKVSLD